MRAIVHISLKPGVLDPQGEAIRGGLASLGFAGVREARVGKTITLDLDESDPAKAKEQVDGMCRRLLANGVIETWSVNLDPARA